MSKAIKKKNSFLEFIFYTSIIGVLGYGFYLYKQNVLEKKSEQTYYKAFGISIPNGYTINGIDVSKYQNYIYWKNVKQMNINNVKIDFAFIKATEGLYTVDGMFKRNWKLSKQNGVTRGAYHFFISSRDGKKQAEHFLDHVDFTKGDLLPVIDVEDDNGQSKAIIVKRVKEFANEIEKQLKVKPIIYSYVNFYEKYLQDDFANYPLWIAHYNADNEPATNSNWKFWQHSDEGRVNGITEHVDFNVFKGSAIEFEKMLLK